MSLPAHVSRRHRPGNRCLILANEHKDRLRLRAWLRQLCRDVTPRIDWRRMP